MWLLECFGGFRAVSEKSGDTDASKDVIERFRTQKTASLLALLALRGRHRREDVATLLWPDAAPEASRNSLSAALSSLRRDLGESILVTDRHAVAIAPDLIATDVQRFDAAFREQNWARATEIYRGHLLPGFHDEPFPALAAEYEEKARTAFAQHLQVLADDDNAFLLLQTARRAAQLFGPEERWFLAQMRAQSALGDIDAALRTYTILQRHARSQGDVASETARALSKQLRAEKERLAAVKPESPIQAESENFEVESEHDSNENTDALKKRESASPVLTSNLPPQWTRFFGREAEREMLRVWLCRGEKLITLTGAGGSGKTRLALETVRDLMPNVASPTDITSPPDVTSASTDAEITTCEFEHFVFVPLASLSAADLMPEALRDALGLPPSPDLSPLEQLSRVLNGRSCVFLLDNLEQLLPAVAPVLQGLRVGLPQVAFVVTSRALLHLPGEREFPVSPLPTPLPGTSERELSNYPSAELFCDRSGVPISSINASAVGALCRRLDGIPLALELAAARAKVLSPAQIVERLEHHPNFLQSRELGVPERHKTLRATIEWSTSLLPDDLRAFFAHLCVFRGGWTLEAAEAVCDEPEALEMLTLLRENSLIRVEENSWGESRFRMLETLREFGREELQVLARDRIERAFFTYFLQLAQRAASAMQGPQQTLWLSRLDVEQDNLRAALTWAQTNDAARGLQLATALIDFWETRLALAEGRHWIEAFLNATVPTTQSPVVAPLTASPLTAPPEFEAQVLGARARALTGAGRLAWYSSDIDEANALLEAGIQAAQATGDTSTIVYATRTMTRVSALAGQGARTREIGREATHLARESGDRSLLLKSLMDQGFADINVGDFATAREVCTEAVTLARKVGDERALSLALAMAGITHSRQNDNATALPLLQEAENVARDVGAPREAMISLASRGEALGKMGHFEASQRVFNDALDIARTSFSETWSTVSTLFAVAYTFFRRGDAEGATILMSASEALRERINYTLMPFLVDDYQHFKAASRQELGDNLFAALWQRGSSMTVEAAFDFAINRALPTSTLTASDSAPASTCSAPETPQNASQHTVQLFTIEQETLATRARALSAAGRLASHGDDVEKSRRLVIEGLETARSAGSASGFAYAVAAFTRMAMTTGDEGDIAQSLKLSEETVENARTANDRSALLESLQSLMYARTVTGDLAGVARLQEETIALARAQGDESRLLDALHSAAHAAYLRGAPLQTLGFLNESEPLARRSGSQWGLMTALWMRSFATRALGDFEQSRVVLLEELGLFRANSALRWAQWLWFPPAAYWLCDTGQMRAAITIMAAAQTMGETSGYRLVPVLRREHNSYLEHARQVLAPDDFEAAWRTGNAMTPEAACDFARVQLLQTDLDALLATHTSAESEVAEESDAVLAMRSRALSGAARLAWHHSDFEASRALVQESLAAAGRAGDVRSMVYAVASFVLFAITAGDENEMTRARELSAKTLQSARESGEPELLLKALITHCYAGVATRHVTGSRALHAEALQLARALGDEGSLDEILRRQASLLYNEGDYAAARSIAETSLELAQRLGSPFSLSSALWNSSNVAREQGRLQDARAFALEAVAICRGNEAFKWNVANFLLVASYAFFRLDDARSAARLMGACETVFEISGYRLVPALRGDYERYQQQTRTALGETVWEAEWHKGRAMTPEAAIDFALHH